VQQAIRSGGACGAGNRGACGGTGTSIAAGGAGVVHTAGSSAAMLSLSFADRADWGTNLYGETEGGGFRNGGGSAAVRLEPSAMSPRASWTFAMTPHHVPISTAVISPKKIRRP
jgi:hypothetical protein